MRAGDAFAEGRFRFVADVMLHEMIHQYHFELTGETEDAFHSHGPHFRDVCNRIGAALGLPPVRSAKKRGQDAHLPSCAQWPHNVRPADYYLGAYVPPTPAKPPAPVPVPSPTCAEVATLVEIALADLEAGNLDEVQDILENILALVPVNRDEGET